MKKGDVVYAAIVEKWCGEPRGVTVKSATVRSVGSIAVTIEPESGAALHFSRWKLPPDDYRLATTPEAALIALVDRTNKAAVEARRACSEALDDRDLALEALAELRAGKGKTS